MQNYTIKTEHFEGPFDLLLFFIERDELDINDIPISEITRDFLDYIHQLEELNIDVASEFILVAASLMRIKAKMLLPRKELDQDGNEIDPRLELTQKLLEYKKFKDVISDLEKLEQNRNEKHIRGNNGEELRNIAQTVFAELEMESISLYGLLNAFRKVMEKFEQSQNKTVHRIIRYNYTVEDQRKYILSRLKPGKKIAFNQIFAGLENKIHAVITFLSLLEMLNRMEIRLIQGGEVNSFWISLNPNDEEEE